MQDLLKFDSHYNQVIYNFINKKIPPIHANLGRRALKLALVSIKSFKNNKTVNL